MRSGWHSRVMLACAVVAAVAMTAQAKRVSVTGGPNLGELVIGLVGGLALFLYGMEQMADALRAAAGDRLKRLLARLTRNRLSALLTGTVVTAVVQSSSATTVMVVGFISLGLMNLTQALGVILGADIGGTITPQLVAFDLFGYALVIVAVGVAAGFVARDNETRQLARLLVGLGLIFYGLKMMSTAMHPFREYQPFLDLLASLRHLGLAVTIAAIFTALVHSSAATVGIAVVFAAEGLIPLEAGIGLVLGANLGTCATAGLAAMGKPREAQRAALGHVLFKLLGVLLVSPLLDPFIEIVRGLSPADPARQIANAHTLFNVLIATLFLPVCGAFARLLCWLRPDLAEADVETLKPRYLDRSLVDSPTLALGLVRREVGRIGDRLQRMIDILPTAVFDGNRELADTLPAIDDQVDTLYEAIAAYLTEVGQGSMSPDTADEVLAAITATAELEAIGDVMETNLVHAARRLATDGLAIDGEARRWLDQYHDQVRRAFVSTMVAFVSNDRQAAATVLDAKDPLTNLDLAVRSWHLDALRHGPGQSATEVLTVTLDILENLRRLYYHSKRVAKLVVRAEGAAAWTSASAGEAR